MDNEDGDRNARGQFTGGNDAQALRRRRGGGNHRLHSTMRELQRLMVAEALKRGGGRERRLTRIMREVLRQAEAGNLEAAKIIFDRVLGKVQVDRQPAQSSGLSPAAGARVAFFYQGPSIDLAEVPPAPSRPIVDADPPALGPPG